MLDNETADGPLSRPGCFGIEGTEILRATAAGTDNLGKPPPWKTNLEIAGPFPDTLP